MVWLRHVDAADSALAHSTGMSRRSTIAAAMASRTAAASNPPGVSDRPLPLVAPLQDCEVRGVLARSSFAVLYDGYDHALKTRVAIKEYLPEALALHDAAGQVVLRDPLHAEAFERGLQAFIGEAELLARCAHPSLLHVLRVVRCHGTAYRLMRHHPHPTLLQYRQQSAAPITAQTLRRWLDDLLGALQAVHDEGCIHGAVAPGNILMQPDLRPLLLDLDAVRGVLVSDRTQSLMATLAPCFEPPEQRAASCLVTGFWTDLYSLAATLHFCIGAQLPAPPRAASGAARYEPLASLWQRLREAHPAIDAEPDWLQALDAWLSEDPQQRPQSVAEAKASLDAPRVTTHDTCAVVCVETPAAPAAAVDPPSSSPDEDAATAPRLPARADTAQPVGTARRRWHWPVGVAALVAMTTVVAITGWPGQRVLDAAAPAPLPVARVTSAEVPAAGPTQVTQPPPMAEPAAPVSAAAPVSTAAPVAAAAASAAPAPPPERVVRMATSPRQLCGARVRYQLLQCMQTQCAKRAWTKHEQCRRLRQENRLS
jgi:hypothetical protein